MPSLKRRKFLQGVAAGLAGAAIPAGDAAAASTSPDSGFATLIDLTRCDGCPRRGTPACVAACRKANASRMPQPDPKMLKPYWPQPKFEDWSKKRHITSRLTPYNWLYVQRLKVKHKGREHSVSIPRRCMHCDNPVCVKLCPFGSMKKDTNGPTHVNTSMCMGGAKCRTVCPWNVPQRQAGVGLYTHLDPMPVGGGVMYKCDLCRDRLAEGKEPACMAACPRKAMTIGPRTDILSRAEAARKKGLHVYGREEHGGTSTIYISAVPFEKLDAAVVAEGRAKKSKLPPKRRKKVWMMRLHNPRNMLAKHMKLAGLTLSAPVLGAAAALTLAGRRKNKTAEENRNEGESRASNRTGDSPERSEEGK